MGVQESEKEVLNRLQMCEKKWNQNGKENLLQAIHDDKGLPPMIAYYGDKNGFTECLKSNLICGEDIFDLASITKFFLAYVYIYIDEDKELQRELKIDLNLNKTVGNYTKESFTNIGNIRIVDMLSFNVNLETDGRIDDFDEKSYDEAYKCLNNIKGEYSKKQVYSDMPMLVLAELLYVITGKTFGEWVDELIVEKCKLTHTFWNYEVAQSKNIDGIYSMLDKCIDYTGEYRVKASGKVECYQYQKGLPHDTKARILSNKGTKLCGNSGLFASAEDVCTILQTFLNGDEKINRVLYRIVLGNGWDKESEKNSFGYGCYRKYYNAAQNEVPIMMSPYTIVASGFTGCYLALDLMNECFIFIGSNRLSGYISKLNSVMELPEEQGNIIINGNTYKSSVKYVYQRDIIRDELSTKVFCEKNLQRM